jgi:RimJ/RimL family protein N-acetyltransferase
LGDTPKAVRLFAQTIKGYGRAALKSVQQLAFAQLQAHRLWLDVKDHNSRARHLYQAMGFVEEGRLRECVKSGNRFESLVVLSMLRSEYQP